MRQQRASVVVWGGRSHPGLAVACVDSVSGWNPQVVWVQSRAVSPARPSGPQWVRLAAGAGLSRAHAYSSGPEAGGSAWPAVTWQGSGLDTWPC